MAGEKKKVSWIWPSVADMSDATRASDQAFWAAIVVAGITAAFATFALTTGSVIGSIDASAYIDAALFAIIAWRIKRRSRAWSVVGLALYLAEKIFQIAENPAASSGIVMALVIMLLLVGGVRGNFAIYKLNQAQKQSLPEVGV